ncbi:MAG: D-glycero-beta-D-manno-heptose 1-phosphate adenylyltransferase [Candidatus Kapaibacteriota bacterium]
MLISKDTLGKIVLEAKLQGKKIVFTNGCFDIIHSGHIYYLSEAKKCGDLLIIGLNTDDSVSRLKGPSRPINRQHDRATVLAALKPVDYVCFFDEDTPMELIKFLNPDVLVKGADYKENEVVGADFVKSQGGKVVLIPFVEGKSTTNIINKMK